MYVEKCVTQVEGYVYDEIMSRDFVASMFPLARVKCLVAAGGFDEEMAACQDYDMWTRAAKHYEFAYVDEALGKLHRYSGEHIWSNLSKPIRGRNRFLSKNRDYFMTHKYAYWQHLRALCGMYRRNGQYSESLKTWLTMMRSQPLRVWGNTKTLVKQFMVEPLKPILREKFPTLFQKLRRIKRKLKGESLN